MPSLFLFSGPSWRPHPPWKAQLRGPLLQGAFGAMAQLGRRLSAIATLNGKRHSWMPTVCQVLCEGLCMQCLHTVSRARGPGGLCHMHLVPLGPGQTWHPAPWLAGPWAPSLGLAPGALEGHSKEHGAASASQDWLCACHSGVCDSGKSLPLPGSPPWCLSRWGMGQLFRGAVSLS